MNNVVVEKLPDWNQPSPVLRETAQLLDSVRQRAFELFEERGGTPGNEVSDWLRAEKELFRVPDTELAEIDGEFQLELALPGFEAKDIHVAALPDSVIVEGEATHQHRGMNGTVHFCEFGERRLFRQIPLPKPAGVDHVSVTLDKGVLRVRVAKAEQEKSRKASRAFSLVRKRTSVIIRGIAIDGVHVIGWLVVLRSIFITRCGP